MSCQNILSCIFDHQKYFLLLKSKLSTLKFSFIFIQLIFSLDESLFHAVATPKKLYSSPGKVGPTVSTVNMMVIFIIVVFIAVSFILIVDVTVVVIICNC